MNNPLKFIIVDGYPAESRLQLSQAGMKLAAHLYQELIHKYLPEAQCDLFFSSDPGVELPAEEALTGYQGMLWPGCNLTIYHDHDTRVTRMLDLARRGYKVGIPQFGSCWGVQVAVCAAGGKVAPNPRGREMGLARKIHLTDAGKNHPMFKGKPPVFDGFISHDDEIVEWPPYALHLAGNDFTRVQAVAVEFEKGVFWATQYHPEYDLHEMARLIVAREERLIKYGFFHDKADLQSYVENLEAVYSDPTRKDLRWQLAIDDDVLDDSIRHREFVNWLQQIVIPYSIKIS